MPVVPTGLSSASILSTAPMFAGMADACIAGVAITVLAAYVFLLGPGQAWWRGTGAGTPRLFARVAVSSLWTTLAGLVLTACDSFSLPRLVVLSGIAMLVGYLCVERIRCENRILTASRAIASIASALPVLLALWLYWPPYETHIAASDSTTYIAAGTHLARSHHLWKRDPLIARVPPLARQSLFFSVMGVPWKPPYTRMPGGLVIDTPNSDVVRPSFFPAPIIWSALFADTLGPRYAGGFAPLFAALAVWAFWIVARRRVSAPAALLATLLVALNAATYWAGRFPLAEPIAWFFLWGGLAALDAYEDQGFPADARIAGALLAGAGLVRLELLPFLLVALLLRYLMRAELGSRPLTPGFAAWATGIGAAALAETHLLPGAYALPLSDTLTGILYRLHVAWTATPLRTGALAAVLAGVIGLAVRRLGFARTIAAGAVLGFVVAYTVLASHQSVLRSLYWLCAYIGPLALGLGAAGAALAWHERRAVPGDGFFVVLAGLTTCLLVYAPHVYPLMPWASRRFVPLVIPALILWSVLAATRLRSRSAFPGMLAVISLAATVTWPARGLWAAPFYERSYEEMKNVAEQLPNDGTLLIDGRLIPLLLSTPLWLAFDRNSLPIDVSTVRGRQTAAALVYTMSKDDLIYLVKPSTAPVEPIPFVASRRILDFEVSLALPEQTTGPPPQRLDPYVQLVSVFELQPWKLPPK